MRWRHAASHALRSLLRRALALGFFLYRAKHSLWATVQREAVRQLAIQRGKTKEPLPLSLCLGHLSLHLQRVLERWLSLWKVREVLE